MRKIVFHNNASILVSALFWFITINVCSQSFERVESTVGLGMLSENNGVAVADYDGDNDLDVFVVAKAKDNPERPNTLSRLFRNNNDGSFTDVTEFAGFENLLSQEEGGDDYFGLDGLKSGASWGDYNNDGFPDLFLTYSFKVQLWRNNGDGTFTDTTSTSGFQDLNECRNTGATWFDYNNDGFLDIYVNDWDECESNQLFRNNGNSTFTNVTSETVIKAEEGLASYVAFPFDFNKDGFLDLYISNDFDDPNDLYINNNGSSFSNEAEAYGVDTMGDDMGITIGDYNKDGFFDFFITAIDNNFLLTNNGDNTFTENANAFNLDNTFWSWGTKFADFDLDGDEDLFVANGFVFQERNVEPNFYFENTTVQGETAFLDRSADLGLNEMSVAVEALDLDYDNDGDLDLLVTNSDTSIFLYENRLLNFDDEQPSQNWLKIVLRGTISNRDAIGTEITVETENDSYKRYYSGVGFLGQSLKPVHFGLGSSSEIQSIEIRWPSGIIETFSDLNPNKTFRVIEGQGIDELSVEPSQKVYGCTDPLSCSFNPEATLDDGSCTYLNSNAISGNLNPSVLSNQTYSYAIDASSIANWTVTGGTIIDGQGTGSVEVHWDIADSGTISVRESDENCSSRESTVAINLSFNDLPENISIARLWNEALLEAIRGDFARPTIHARNLFHTSIAMYDIWAILNTVKAKPYLVGNSVNGFSSEFLEFIPLVSKELSMNEALSFAMYRLLSYRFQNSPGAEETLSRIDLIMEKLGYDTSDTSLMYEFGNAAALGNYVAQTVIDYGIQDGSRESTGFDNAYYTPVNDPYALDILSNSPTSDPNRWRPLALDIFIDQGGNVVDGEAPEFLSPEWGNVWSFALSEEDLTIYQREGDTYRVFHDPLDPPYINENTSDLTDPYKWGFAMVSVWQSHLDPEDGVIWDISPAAKGNVSINEYPSQYSQYPEFYDFFEGSALNNGHDMNPFTGNPYEPNMVPRADYARVLAEFWADGPDSETPPGHWFTILNYVSDHPELQKRFSGSGELLEPLEWDIKSYFILGSTMHDAAIAAWSVKGWYDYIRPISALRYMGAEQGQSSDPSLPNYSATGLPLIEGFIEQVTLNDELAGSFNENVGKIKLYTWKGHDFIEDPENDTAGVGWILAENWYPYQKPTFVTPPFAGFVSGHSTFSRAAAEVLTNITGSEYFPGGVGEFVAKKNEFLVFEEGPSQDVVLQWASYRDASDQTSLSRIWGGIHPPADDIPGRLIGIKVAEDTWELATSYFQGQDIEMNPRDEIKIFPNPTTNRRLSILNTRETDRIEMFDLRGRKITVPNIVYNNQNNTTELVISQSTASGLYMVSVNGTTKLVIIDK